MNDAPGHIDYSRATRLLIYTNPDRIDLDGINAVLTDIQSDSRATQAILALCTIAHSRDKALSTDQGVEALRQIVAALTLRAQDDDN
jgi:hypothetical protein